MQCTLTIVQKRLFFTKTTLYVPQKGRDFFKVKYKLIYTSNEDLFSPVKVKFPSERQEVYDLINFSVVFCPVTM